MSLIERWWHVDDGGDDPQAMYWTDSEDTARLARESGYGVVEYVPEAQLAGAVEALKLIACARAQSGQHAIDVGLARNALEAMGVDPSLWRGQ